jgi:hypothetical protein
LCSQKVQNRQWGSNLCIHWHKKKPF